MPVETELVTMIKTGSLKFIIGFIHHLHNKCFNSLRLPFQLRIIVTTTKADIWLKNAANLCDKKRGCGIPFLPLVSASTHGL
jgi:hypothetical protein